MTKIVNTREARYARLDAELEELEAIEDDKKEDETLSPEEKTWKKRHSDLRSYTAKKENDLKAEIATLKSQLSEATKKQLKFPKTEEEVDAWMKSYPDVAGIVETIAMKKVAEVRKEIEDRDLVLQERAYNIELDKWMNFIVSKHSDFFTLREDEKFIDWVREQPKYIRNAFADEIAIDDLEDAAHTIVTAIDLFKLKNAPKKKQPDSRDAARGVLSREQRAQPSDNKDRNLIYESDIMALSRREYTDEVDDMVNKAMREGRFVQDVTGAAR